MKLVFALPIFAALCACANSGANYTPILDGQQTAAYRSDLAACQNLARNQKQFDRQTASAAAIGAGAGAVLGDLDADGDALGGAIAGALAGGLSGAMDASERREALIVECMRGRGHNVVG